MIRNKAGWSLSRSLSGLVFMLIAMLVLSGSSVLADEPVRQKSFASAQQAVSALVAAVKAADDAELLAIFGPGSEDLISSGDQVADRNGRARFLNALAEKSGLDQKDPGRVVLLVGGKEYPFPIPIVRQGDAWFFDTRAGSDEILNRRIGRNELHTIEVMQAYTAAQREYACMKRDGGGVEFAQRLASSKGEKDGLYWQAGAGEEESPFGPLIARATEEGYADGLDDVTPEPFHGYFFKILKAQGEHAVGGAFDYLVDGRMVLGFALVAYPSSYGAGGIMSFIVNQQGVIYEKDLGEQTATTAAAMVAFDPDDSWRRYEKPAGQ